MPAMKKLRVVTMIGGLDLIGELLPDGSGNLAMLEHPCLIQRQSATNLTLLDLLKTGVLDGTYIELNLGAVLWTGAPTKQLKDAYQSHRVGLLLPGPQATLRQNG
jgi:hypothetical protein